ARDHESSARLGCSRGGRRRSLSSEASMDVRVGSVIARHYQIEQQIGQGGMGSIWIARDLRLDRRVALKLMHDNLGGRAEPGARFSREARALARVQSPHIVQVFDTGVEDDGTRFIAMELLVGEDLETYLARREPLSVQEAYAVFGPVLEAL